MNLPIAIHTCAFFLAFHAVIFGQQGPKMVVQQRAKAATPNKAQIVEKNSSLDLTFKEPSDVGMLEVAGQLRYTSASSITLDEKNALHVTRGGKAVLHAGNTIYIGPGLRVEEGAEFSASVDTKINSRKSHEPGGRAADQGSESKPAEYSLSDNYPNPFNPSTVIQFSLPENVHVKLKVYDALGREVRTLVDRLEGPGIMSVSFDATNIPSGVYFYRLNAGSFSSVKKMVLMK